MNSTALPTNIQTGETYRMNGGNVDMVITKVTADKVSYRINGIGRQRTFTIASFLKDTHKVKGA